MRRFIMLAGLILLAATAGQAQVLHVPDDYTTIQGAIDAAPENAEIIIDVGTYDERPYVNKSLTITGVDQANVIIDAGAATSGSYGFTVIADDVTISSLTLVGDTSLSTLRYGFKPSSVSNFTMIDVTAREFNRTGVDLLGVTNGTLTNVSSLDNGGHGLSLCDCNGVTVTNLTVSGNAWQGVCVATWGEHSTLGTSDIVFTGTNDFQDPFQIEMGDNNNPGPAPAGDARIDFSGDPGDGADVTVQTSELGFAVYGLQDDAPGQERIWLVPTLADAALLMQTPVGHFTGEAMFAADIADPTSLHVTEGGSIQAAIDAAEAGNTINVGPGLYPQNFDIHKRVTVAGAGAGDDPLLDTIITQDTTGAGDTKIGVVQLTASGLSELEPIRLQDMRLAPDGMAGISVGRFTEATGQTVEYVALDNVHVIGTNVNPSTEQERGLYVDLSSTLRYLDVDDCAFDNLTYGWYFQKEVSADASTVQYVTVDNTTFSHNNHKGLYAEKLSDATFTGCSVDGNGFDSAALPSYFQAWSCGIDINLKAGAYAHLAFEGCTVTNNAIDEAKEGAGLTVKARDDGGTYGAFPASVDGVTVTGCTVTGNERGLRFGEPGKGNATPTNVVVHDCTLSGNVQHYSGVDGSDYGDFVNMSTATDDATGNWWGDSDPSDQVAGSGPTNVSPWYDAPPGTTPMTWGVDTSIQAAVDAADPGDTILVEPGSYVEALLIEKPLSIYGATAGVNKNGYMVPADYAWDPAVESIITHPDPAGGYTTIVDIHDTGDVIFDGFVVGELNAVGNLNSSLMRVYAHTHAISNVKVENCVIGPNTNVTAQDGAQGRMGLYLVNHPYGTNGIENSSFSHNKVFDAKGNGDNIFLWTSYYAYGAAGPADMSGTVIHDNEIYGSHRSGIETAGGFANLTISNNTIYGNSELPGDDPDKLKYGHGIQLIRGSSDKVSDPLTAYGPVDLLVTGNTIYGNSKCGVYMGPKNDSIVFTNNVIRDNGWNGVMVDLAGNYWNPQFESPPASEQYACYDCSEDVSGYDNEIYGNGVSGNALADYGVAVNGAPTNGFEFEAAGNWWGSASGPYHPTLNATGTGDSVTDHVVVSPWSGMATISALPASSGPINCGETVTLAVHYAPDPLTPELRGFTMTVACSAELTFSDVDTDSDPDTFGDIRNLGVFDALGSDYFTVLDNNDGTYTIDSALLGGSTGQAAAVDLFEITFHPVSDGDGEVTITDVILRDTVNDDIGADVADAIITVDCTAPPGVTDLSSAPGHEQVTLDWTMADASDVDHYEIWRAVWHTGDNVTSAYPEYDDVNPVEPVWPADHAAAGASGEWERINNTVAGTATSYVDDYAPRGIYYYEVYAVDAADNVGPGAGPSNRSTNYWLGDVDDDSGGWDGRVDVSDIDELAYSYGYGSGDLTSHYNAHCDIGPTDDRSGVGIPTTDNFVGFEDLMIIALNYGNVSKRAPTTGSSEAVLVWARIDATTWALQLAEPCADLVGVRLVARLPEGVTCESVAGDLLAGQTEPAFVGVGAGGLDVGAALLGRGSPIDGTGDLLRVTFSENVVVEPQVFARSGGNADLRTELSTETEAATPSVFAARQNYPNPFNPSTTISFDLPEAREVRLAVYAVDGSLVRTLVSGELPSGVHDIVWDGRDDRRQTVATGAYFYRLQAGSDSEVRKMLLMK